MVNFEHGCSVSYKVVALKTQLESLGVVDGDRYPEFLAKTNTAVVISVAFRAISVHVVPEFVTPASAALASTAIFALTRYESGDDISNHLSSRAIARLNSMGIQPCVLEPKIPKNKYNLWLVSLPVILEVVSNLFRLVNLDERSFKNAAYARQFYGPFAFSVIAMTTNIVVFKVFGPQKNSANHLGSRLDQNQTIVIVKRVPNWVHYARTLIVNSAIFSAYSLIGTLAKSGPFQTMGISAAAAVMAAVPTHALFKLDSRNPPVGDSIARRSVERHQIILETAESLTPPTTSTTANDVSELLTAFFLSGALIAFGQVAEQDANDPDSSFFHILIAYSVMQLIGFFCNWLFLSRYDQRLEQHESNLNNDTDPRDASSTIV